MKDHFEMAFSVLEEALPLRETFPEALLFVLDCTPDRLLEMVTEPKTPSP